MIVPLPWEFCTRRDLPPVSSRTFNDLFWNIVHTYAGHSRESLQLLREGGVGLSKNLQAGSTSLYDVLRPVVPSELLEGGVIPPMVPIEDLPVIDCCEDNGAVMKMRAQCFRYGESVARLLELTRDYSASWGRLRDDERRALNAALTNERASRFHEDDLRACFTDLNLSRKGLQQITADITRFKNLTTLVLSNNPKLTSIPYLPPACQVLVACGCSVVEVCPSTSLNVLGLAYNVVEQLDFLCGLPELRVLDLTRNSVFSMEATMEALRGHPRLEDVTLTGCPIALVDGYSERLVMGCPRLLRLDNAPADRHNRAHPVALEINPSVELRVKLTQLEGLTALMHFPVVREETASACREAKGPKGKKKAKSVILGPVYEWTTTMSLRGSWGGNSVYEGGVVMNCENICIWPDVSGAVQQQPNKSRSQAAVLPIENVRVLNHEVTASLPPTAELSRSLARPFLLEVMVHDEVRFSSGNCVKLTCTIGSLCVDASSLLLNTAPSPRCITLRESLAVSEVALEEKRIHARELRESATAALERLKVLTQPLGMTSGVPTAVGPTPTKRAKFVMATAHGNISEQVLGEAKRQELEEMNLLAEMEERRAEELRQLELAVTLEFSVGSAPKVVEEGLPKVGRTRGTRRRQSSKTRR